jgi:hypothetical protein
MRFAPLIALAALVSFQGTALADMSGNELKKYCAGPTGGVAWGICVGFVSGSKQSWDLAGQLHGPRLFCEPKGVTGDQFIAMTRKYLAANPEQLHYPAAGILFSMVEAAFPCPK